MAVFGGAGCNDAVSDTAFVTKNTVHRYHETPSPSHGGRRRCCTIDFSMLWFAPRDRFERLDRESTCDDRRLQWQAFAFSSLDAATR